MWYSFSFKHFINDEKDCKEAFACLRPKLNVSLKLVNCVWHLKLISISNQIPLTWWHQPSKNWQHVVHFLKSCYSHQMSSLKLSMCKTLKVNNQHQNQRFWNEKNWWKVHFEETGCSDLIFSLQFVDGKTFEIKI